MATMTISLPQNLAKAVKSEAKKQGFATYSEFIRALVRTYFTKTEKFKFEEFKPVSLAKLREEFTNTGKYNQKFIDSLIEGFKNSSVYADKTSK